MASRLAVELEAGRRWTKALALARAEEAGEGALFPQQPGQGQGQDMPALLLEGTPDPSQPSSPPPLSQQQQLSRSTTQIFISLDDVYLCLVNNALGVPIAYVALLETDFRMQQQEAQQGLEQSSLDLSASVGLRAGTCVRVSTSIYLSIYPYAIVPVLPFGCLV